MKEEKTKDELLKAEAKTKEIMKEYDHKIKAYANLDDTIEAIRKVWKIRKSRPKRDI